MKRTLILGIGLLAASIVPAMAADIPVKAVRAAPVVAPAAYNWSGFYTASSVGAQFWDIEGAYVGFAANHNTSGTRAIFGSHAGIQAQFGNWVLGVEGGYNTGYNPRFTSSTSISADCLATGPADRTCQSRVRNYWTIGGKLGYAWDNFMVYATGGYANGRIDTQTFVTSAPAVFTSSTTARHNGWYVGAGFDFYVTKFLWSDLILGIEYQHVEFERRTHIDTLGVALPGTNDRNMRASEDVIRAKATFKYNWAAPVVARY